MKFLTLTLAVFTFSISYGQITTTKIAEAPVKKYDSTENFLGDNPFSYVGQEFYLRGQPEALRDGGYSDFVLDDTKGQFDAGNTYKPNASGLGSKYEDLAGKYFLVLDVTKNSGDENKFFLKLQEKETKNNVYYVYDARYQNSFPFVTTGYFIKNKSAFVGKKFVVRGKNWIDSKPMQDMKTGLPVSNFEPGGVWTAVDLTVEEKYYTLSVVIENAKHEQIPLDVNNLKDEFWVFEYNKAMEYQKKYGQANWQLILQNKVQKGMTEAMCELSWGKPKDVTKTTSDGKNLELWSYDDYSLYFSDGVLFEMK